MASKKIEKVSSSDAIGKQAQQSKKTEKSTESGEKTKLIQKEVAAEASASLHLIKHSVQLDSGKWQGSVNLKVYFAYFRACGNGLAIFIGISYILTYAGQSV